MGYSRIKHGPDTTDSLGYRQNIDACLAEEIGDDGLAGADLNELLEDLKPALARLSEDRENGTRPFLQLPAQSDDLPAMTAVAERFRARFDDVLILGTGGSSLGSRALYEMADRDDVEAARAPNLHIVTNVDPFIFERLIQRLDFRRTGVIAISKSGGTTETMMQLLMALEAMRRQIDDEDIRKHLVLITEPTDNPMRRIADRFALQVLDHDPNVGGRYSVLSVVGMLPTLIAGLDPLAVRAGAETTLRQALEASSPSEIPAALGAAVSIGLDRKQGISSSVMLAYSDRLGSLARWYRQLWAESLGKDGQGTTPIYGTGPVDQHSQLQLWLDGPKDKMFTVLGGPNDPGAITISPDLADDPRLSYMVGRSMGDLMEASRLATAETLAAGGRPVRRIQMARIDERAMGALMMHFMLETVFAAELLGVDPFNQPAVEDGKVRTRAYLKRGVE